MNGFFISPNMKKDYIQCRIKQVQKAQRFSIDCDSLGYLFLLQKQIKICFLGHLWK